MSCHIFTSIATFFSSLENIQEDLPKSRNCDVEKFIQGEENANTKKKTFYDLKLVKKFLVEERHDIREIEKIPPTELDGYFSQFVLAARTKTGKDYEPSSLRGILATAKPSSKTVILKKQETR